MRSPETIHAHTELWSFLEEISGEVPQRLTTREQVADLFGSVCHYLATVHSYDFLITYFHHILFALDLMSEEMASYASTQQYMNMLADVYARKKSSLIQFDPDE